MRRDAFAGYHPAVNFFYFVMVTGFSMFVMHPALLLASFFGGLSYHLYLDGRKALKAAAFMTLPAFALPAFLNPLFTHKGATILTYFKSGNPLTLESIVFGAVSGLMLVCVLNWFSCIRHVMTSDKIIYLFGKAAPSTSLMLSMIFRFIPEFRSRIAKVSDSQKCIGRDVTSGNILSRMRHGLNIMSVMATWALENSAQTADSMRSRGYGLRGRTNFSIYRFDARDTVACGFMAGLGIIVLSGVLTGRVRILFYPSITISPAGPAAVFACISYGILCLLPLMINLIGDAKWCYLKSKI